MRQFTFHYHFTTIHLSLKEGDGGTFLSANYKGRLVHAYINDPTVFDICYLDPHQLSHSMHLSLHDTVRLIGKTRKRCYDLIKKNYDKKEKTI